MGRFSAYAQLPEYKAIFSPAVGLFQAARHARLQDELAQEGSRRQWANLDRQNRLADLQEQELQRRMGQDTIRYQREEAEAQTKAQETINRKLTPGPDFDPEGAKRLSLAYGIGELHQALPQQPVRPGPPQEDPKIAAVLQQGAEQGAAARRGGEAPTVADPVDFALRNAYGGEPAEEGGSNDPRLYQLEQRALQEGREGISARFAPVAEAGGDYLANLQRYKEEQASYPARLAQAQAEPTYEARSKLGAVRFAPAEREKALQQVHSEAADRIAGIRAQIAKVDPYTAQELEIVETKVRQRMVTPEQANKDLNFLLEQRNANQRAQLGLQGRERLARIGAGSREENLEERRRAGDRADAQFLDQAVARWQASTQFKGTVTEFRDLSQGIQNAAALNPLQQKSALYKLGRQINGPGVFTDQDRKYIIDRVSGVVGQTANWLQQAEDGTLDPAIAGIVQQAIQAQLAVVRGKIAADQRSFRARFLEDPYFSNLKSSIQAHENAIFGRVGGETKAVPSPGPGSAPPAGPRPPKLTRGAAKAAGKVSATAPATPEGMNFLRDMATKWGLAPGGR